MSPMAPVAPMHGPDIPAIEWRFDSSGALGTSFCLFALLLLSGCGGAGETSGKMLADAKTEDRIVSCRLNDAPDFADDCSLELRGEDDKGARLFVLRHKDGGFRRLRISADGTLSAADGSYPLVLEKDAGQSLYISLGPDHYRLRLEQMDVAQ